MCQSVPFRNYQTLYSLVTNNYQRQNKMTNGAFSEEKIRCKIQQYYSIVQNCTRKVGDIYNNLIVRNCPPSRKDCFIVFCSLFIEQTVEISIYRINILSSM